MTTIPKLDTDDPRLRAFADRVATVLNGPLRSGSIARNDETFDLAEWLNVTKGTVDTTDATVTTALSYTVPTGNTFFADVYVVGRRTGGAAGANGDSAVYHRQTMANGIKGTIGAVVAPVTQEDQAGWDCTLTISGGNLLVRVTGAVDNNITWTAYLRVYRG